MITESLEAEKSSEPFYTKDWKDRMIKVASRSLGGFKGNNKKLIQ
jgi:hypothetical protein